MILGKSIKEWKNEYPLLSDIIKNKEVFWVNPDYKRLKDDNLLNITIKDIYEAEKRLKRFAPYIKKVFKETRDDEGIIESNLENINNFKSQLESIFDTEIFGDLYIKRDDSLPIAGSIKARGGIYEVLKHAEELALNNNLLNKKDNYKKFASKSFKSFFKNYFLAVGSTGNLGLSIGIIGTAMGFETTVHMSADAQEWKKELLKKKGVIVKEYKSDYSQAVKKGREESKNNKKSYFIDDERSRDLFLGYSVAALRLKKQLKDKNIKIDKEHPLLVYLPCGVGGGPGGICFGLKKIFQDRVHCIFAEPTHSPAMLLGMMTKMHNKITVYKFGIDNITEADGLAVGTPSKFVGKLMENLLAGIYTIEDGVLFKLLKKLYKTNNIKLEPSALAGFTGPIKTSNNIDELNFLKKKQLNKGVHIIWATGGSMVPDNIFKEYLVK